MTTPGATQSQIDPWTRLPPDGIRRLADLARTSLRARAAIVAPPDSEPPRNPTEACLVVPIRASGGDIIGTLRAIDEELRVWTENDHAQLGAIAACVASLLELAAKTGMREASGVSVAPAAAPPALPAPAVGSRVLLADDLDLNRKLIADMLSLEGHVVDCVSDGAAAVAAAAAKTYDLILMDMIMPGMDGIAATRAIRAMPAPAGNVPIVALTANSFPEQLDSCLDAGMDATLTKPMSIDALTRAVSTWTRSRSQAA